MYKFLCWMFLFSMCEAIVELPLNTDYSNPESENTEFLLNVPVPSYGVMITVRLDYYYNTFNICADTQPITVDPPCSYARWQGVPHDRFRQITIPAPFEKQGSETESIYIYLDPRYKTDQRTTILFANLLPGEDISHLAMKKGIPDVTYLLLTSNNTKEGNWYYLNVDSFMKDASLPTVTLTLQSCIPPDISVSFGIGSARASNAQNITAGLFTDIIPGYIYEPIVLYTNWTMINYTPAMLQTALDEMPPPRLLYFSPPTGYYELIIKIMPNAFTMPDENIVRNVRVNDDLFLRFRSRNSYFSPSMNYALYVGDSGGPTIKYKCGFSKYNGKVDVLNEVTYITLVAPNFFQQDHKLPKYAVVESSADFAFPEYYAPTFITTKTYTMPCFWTSGNWVLLICVIFTGSTVLIILFKGILAVGHRCCKPKKSTPVSESQLLLNTHSDEQ